MSSSRPVYRSMQSANTAVASKLRPRSLSSSFFMPFLFASTPTRSRPRRSAFFEPSASLCTASNEQLRSKFVDALVQAGTCRHGANRDRRRQASIARCQSTLAIRRSEEQINGDLRVDEAKRARNRARTRRSPYTRDEYLNLVDHYEVPETLGEQRPSENISNRYEDQSWSSENAIEDVEDTRYLLYTGPDETVVIKELEELIHSESATPEHIFEHYQRLPVPGIQSVPPELRHLLIKRLSVYQHKSKKMALSFLSVLEDYKSAGMPIPEQVWLSAMHLAGKTASRVGDAEVEVSVRTWKDMENLTRIKSQAITFNILLDIAVKAQKFGLAKLVEQEMQSRGIKMSRFTRVGRIFAHGIRRDSAAIRDEYRDFVDSGEIIDTVVLNCVVVSLLACGEPEAAEAVFSRMVDLSAEREGKTYVSRSWSKEREIAKILSWVVQQAQKGHFKPIARETLQSSISIAPNARTCNSLLSHYCGQGELHRAVEMLDHLQRLSLRPTNQTFMHLMKGFFVHGGIRYSTWTASRLEAVWEAYLKLLDGADMDLHLTKWMVLNTLRAFRKCCGAQKEIEVWNEIQSRWSLEYPLEDIAPRPHDGVSSWQLFRG